MTLRTTARELITNSQRLMDGLLDVEESCFKLLDAGVQQTADATRERIVAASRLSRAQLLRGDLVPDDRWLVAHLLPPVGQLIAVARERSTAMAGRQMATLVGHIGSHAAPTAQAAQHHTARVAPEIEQLVYTQATDALATAVAPVRAAVDEQRRTWAARHEPLDALVARCCTQDRVGLPGATRGVVWQLRPRLHALARAASVDTANALLMAGMQAWNDHTVAA